MPARRALENSSIRGVSAGPVEGSADGAPPGSLLADDGDHLPRPHPLPRATRTSRTTPVAPAAMAISAFIASTTPIASPSAIRSPGARRRRQRLPATGLVTAAQPGGSGGASSRGGSAKACGASSCPAAAQRARSASIRAYRRSRRSASSRPVGSARGRPSSLRIAGAGRPPQGKLGVSGVLSEGRAATRAARAQPLARPAPRPWR
jgi:hypothetical protein